VWFTKIQYGPYKNGVLTSAQGSKIMSTHNHRAKLKLINI